MSLINTTKFAVGTIEYEQAFEKLFCDFPMFNIELVSYDRYTEIYKVNNQHRVIYHINREIIIEYHYFYNRK